MYSHFHQWKKDGSFKNVWIHLLSSNRSCLDPLRMQVAGTHSPAKRGDEAVAYQGRKTGKPNNCLCLSNNTGHLFAVGTSKEGQYNDLYTIEVVFLPK